MTEQEIDTKVEAFKENTVKTAMAGVHAFRAFAILLRAKMDEKGVITGSLTEAEVEAGGDAMEAEIKGKVSGMGAMLEKLLRGVPKPAILETVVLSKLIGALVDLDNPEKALRATLDETFNEAKAKRVGPYDPAVSSGELGLDKIMERFSKSISTPSTPTTMPAPKGTFKN